MNEAKNKNLFIRVSEKEKNSIEDVIKNLFGGLAGSVVILIFVLVEHFL